MISNTPKEMPEEIFFENPIIFEQEILVNLIFL